MRISDRSLERLAGELGSEAGAGLDVEHVVDGVTARLRAAGGPAPVRAVARWLAIAAGIALIVGAGWLTVGGAGRPPLLGPGPGLVPGLSDLSVSELHQVLDSLRPPAPRGLGGATLDDLDAEQLETLLATMEG
jgi:hypothetical protein